MKPSGGDPGPTVFVLFGATGDLAKRLVLPAFYRLAMQGLLPRDWLLVGNGRGDVSHEDFRKHVHDVLTEFGPQPGGRAVGGVRGPAAVRRRRVRVRRPGQPAGRDGGGKARLGRPAAAGPLPRGPAGRVRPGSPRRSASTGWPGRAGGVREAVRHLAGPSFRALDRVVHRCWHEDQVYRIDHFLGKEATQDLHVLRFAQRPVPRDVGRGARRSRCRSTCRRRSASPTGPGSTTPPARCWT